MIHGVPSLISLALCVSCGGGEGWVAATAFVDVHVVMVKMPSCVCVCCMYMYVENGVWFSS